MTTDPEEGRRQIEAMQPPALKVGDEVRLKAGGAAVMTVVALEDYGNNAVCEWGPKQEDVNLWSINRDIFPVCSLVKIDNAQDDRDAATPKAGQDGRSQEGQPEQADTGQTRPQG